MADDTKPIVNTERRPLPDSNPGPQNERQQMRRGRGNRAVDNRTVSVFAGDNIQQAVDRLNINKGGRVLFQQGTHNVTEALKGYSNIEFVGESLANTIINFSGSANLSFAGTDVYTTGTITSISNNVIVTGSGTSWLANVTTDHQFLIGQRWYNIAAVTSDITIILAEGFAGLGDLDSFPSVSYRAAKVVEGVEIKELTLQNSSGTGITFDDARDIIMEDTVVTGCNKGIVFTNSTQIAGDRIILPVNTSHGLEFQNSGFGNFIGVAAAGNGGSGILVNASRVLPFNFSSASANTSDGITVTASDTIALTVEAVANGGYGVNIDSSSKNTFVTIGKLDDTNASGAINDLGVGSIHSANKGIIDKSTEKATNQSGGSLALGDIVVIGTDTATDIFNPDAHPETSTVDGMVILDTTTQSYASIIAAAGSSSDDSGTTGQVVMISSTTTDEYTSCRKFVALFPTSAIPDGASIISATVELYATAKVTQMVAQTVVVATNPSSDTALASGDYAGITVTAQSNTIAVSAISTSAYNLYTLNATGLAAINKTGITKFGLMLEEPTWVSDKTVNTTFQTAENSNPPKLNITYSIGIAGDSISTTIIAGDDKVFGMAEETIADTAVGSVLTIGKTINLKVNGTTDIAVGDFLTTFTTVKIAAKAAAGDMAFAVALEAYTTNDSNGIIDARLITPRKL